MEYDRDGHSLPVSAGGYTGFRWVRVPLPDGTKGGQYNILLKPGEGKAAFIAEVRLTLPGGDPQRPDLKQASYKAKATPEKRGLRGWGEFWLATRGRNMTHFL